MSAVLQYPQRLYARHGVAELWVLDVAERVIRVLRDSAAGVFAMVFTVAGGEGVACVALPEARIAAREVF
jgi:hypothetical protein